MGRSPSLRVPTGIGPDETPGVRRGVPLKRERRTARFLRGFEPFQGVADRKISPLSDFPRRRNFFWSREIVTRRCIGISERGGFGRIPTRFRLFSMVCRQAKFPSLPAGRLDRCVGTAATALARSKIRLAGLAGDRLDRRRWGFSGSTATDSRHRRSNKENSMPPDFQKEILAIENLAKFEGRTADVLSDQAADAAPDSFIC